MTKVVMKPDLLMQFVKHLLLALFAAWVCTSASHVVSTASASEVRFATGDMASYKLAAGDRITVTVFNQPDLSGDFLIDGVGNIHLPLLGAVEVGQITIDACQRRLTERLADGLLNNPRVSVRVSEFRPIVVLGDVRVPGSYPFRFGLSALGAIALAGGAGMSEVRQSVATAELLAGEERLKVLETTRLGLSVRLARMEAERLGKSTFELGETTEAIYWPVGDGASVGQLGTLMREEHEELARGLKGHEAAIALLQQQKPRIAKEIEATKEEIATETHMLQLSQARLNEYDKLAKVGLIRATTELEMQRQVKQHEAKVSQLKGQLARLDVGLGDLDIRIQEANNTRQLRVTNELRDTRSRLREIEASLPLVRELLELRRQQVGLVLTATGSPGRSYWIVLTRGLGAAPRVIDGAMLLEPGDIVEVRRLPPDDIGRTTAVTCDKLGEGRSCADRRAEYLSPPSN